MYESEAPDNFDFYSVNRLNESSVLKDHGDIMARIREPTLCDQA